MELTTPTGAAVAVTLATRFGPLPPMTIARTGHGAGTRDFPGQPNVLRVILGETTKADEALTVSVIEANIDDLNPQVLAWSAERRVRARSFTEVDTPYGKVRVKVSSEGDFAPEYEDCRKLAIESGAPLKQIIAEASYAYLNRTR